MPIYIPQPISQVELVHVNHKNTLSLNFQVFQPLFNDISEIMTS